MAYSNVDLIERAAARLDFAPQQPRPKIVTPRPAALAEPRIEDAPFTGEVQKLQRTGTVDWEGARTPIMEEIRLIKRRLLSRAFHEEATAGELSRLVMVTSAKPGEGKTFTSINLALSIALEEDYDIVLVDADITRQSLRRKLGLKQARGFIDLLLDPSLSLSDVMVRTDIPRLSILPAGMVSGRAPELMAGSRMRGMIESIADRFPGRIILFDAPPCLVSSDASTLASHVGQALVVVEADQTQEREVSAALQMIAKCPDISLVLNKARPGQSTSYGGYGAY